MAHDHSLDILSIQRGTVTAPAGCGKTHLIAESLTRCSATKPSLILTHTNAGVVALRARLDRASVPATAYRLFTIDGFAMRLVSLFPKRAACDPALLTLSDPATDYPNIRIAAAKLLKAGHLNDILAGSYTRLIVDEYQDCSVRQHALVAFAARTLPTCVLGDPMQAIFGFGLDELVTWGNVCEHFAIAGELATPWRWINAGGEELGEWLLYVRGKLLRGERIDLKEAPPAVEWVELDGKDDHRRQLIAARASPPDNDGRVLIIGDSRNPNSQRQFASRTPGAVTVEAVDLRDLLTFARRFELTSPDSLNQLTQFAESVMTNVGAADLVSRVQALHAGRTRKPASGIEAAALSLIRAPSYQVAINLLAALGQQPGVRTHRPAVLRACIKAFQLCQLTEGLGFAEAAIRIREQNRLVGRPLPLRAVGSTLLLKGLEAEVSVILDATEMNARNLYVAMTRGSKRLIICSRSPVLQPTP